MTIDAKELDKAIAYYDGLVRPREEWSPQLKVLYAAASAYAATLPREVTLEGWAVVRPDGSVSGLYEQESTAIEIIRRCQTYKYVRLTGTAVLPRVKD